SGLFEQLQQGYLNWRDRCEVLFKEGVLNIMPPIDFKWNDEIIKHLNEAAAKWSPWEEIGRPLIYENENKDRDLGVANYILDPAQFYCGSLALAVHATLAPKKAPELFVPTSADLSTSRLAWYLGKSLFQYRVPQLAELHPEEILEVREDLRELRET